MFRCSEGKAQWYLQRNLAVKLEDAPLIVQLTFEPKGNGHVDDPYHLQKMENRCVVCGGSDELTRHHIVPYCYRKFFPDELKNHRSYDVMALCINCHHLYEKQAWQLKVEIGHEYEMPVSGINIYYDVEVGRARGAAFAILNNLGKIPAPRLEELHNRIRHYLKKEDITKEDLRSVASLETYNFKDYVHHGQYVMSKIPIDELNAFAKKWRLHFLKTMQPQFMPQHWTVDRSLWCK